MLIAAKTFVEILRLVRDWSSEQEKNRLENLKNRIELIERIEGLRRASPELLILLDKDIGRLLINSIKIIDVEESDRREG
jgi:hypothetical protein